MESLPYHMHNPTNIPTPLSKHQTVAAKEIDLIEQEAALSSTILKTQHLYNGSYILRGYEEDKAFFLLTKYTQRKVLQRISKLKVMPEIRSMIFRDLMNCRRFPEVLISMVNQNWVENIELTASKSGSCESKLIQRAFNSIIWSNPVCGWILARNIEFSEKAFWRFFWAWLDTATNVFLSFKNVNLTRKMDLGDALDKPKLVKTRKSRMFQRQEPHPGMTLLSIKYESEGTHSKESVQRIFDTLGQYESVRKSLQMFLSKKQGFQINSSGRYWQKMDLGLWE